VNQSRHAGITRRAGLIGFRVKLAEQCSALRFLPFEIGFRTQLLNEVGFRTRYFLTNLWFTPIYDDAIRYYLVAATNY